ncbi:MAG: glycosyltransferase family 4 protein [Planctomycetota bacterium]
MRVRPSNGAAWRVVVVGPDESHVGGMSSVAQQTLRIDLGERFTRTYLPFTHSNRERESLALRLLRHVVQSVRVWRAGHGGSNVIVHLHTCSGFTFYRSLADVLLAKAAGGRTILHVHGAAFDRFYDESGRIGRWMIRSGLASADRVVALSAGWRRKLLAMASGANVVVIENAVAEPSVGNRAEASGVCRFLVLSRMDAWKGIDDVLDACLELRRRRARFHLTLAGPPGTAGGAAELTEKIQARNLAGFVEYVGTVVGKEKEVLLRRADVFVLPSHHEGMPISLLEALSHGLAVVATTVGAVPEVVDPPREGLLVPPHEPARLADAMGKLLADEALRRAMGTRARGAAVTRFSERRLRQDLTTLYDDLTRSSEAEMASTEGSEPNWRVGGPPVFGVQT